LKIIWSGLRKWPGGPELSLMGETKPDRQGYWMNSFLQFRVRLHFSNEKFRENDPGEVGYL
jgi:hypothetical protein